MPSITINRSGAAYLEQLKANVEALHLSQISLGEARIKFISRDEDEDGENADFFEVSDEDVQTIRRRILDQQINWRLVWTAQRAIAMLLSPLGERGRFFCDGCGESCSHANAYAQQTISGSTSPSLMGGGDTDYIDTGDISDEETLCPNCGEAIDVNTIFLPSTYRELTTEILRTFLIEEQWQGERVIFEPQQNPDPTRTFQEQRVPQFSQVDEAGRLEGAPRTSINEEEDLISLT